MTKQNLTPITFAAMLAGWGESPAWSQSEKRASTAPSTAPVGQALYTLSFDNDAKGEGITDGCTLTGRFTNGSDEPSSHVVITYQPIFTPETAEQVTFTSYCNVNIAFGRSVSDRAASDLDVVALGEPVPMKGVAHRNCEDVSEAKLNYLNCQGIAADGTQHGRRCDVAKLKIENKANAPLSR